MIQQHFRVGKNVNFERLEQEKNKAYSNQAFVIAPNL